MVLIHEMALDYSLYFSDELRNEISLESIDIREFNFHTHFLRILYKKYFEAVNTQWFINLFAMFIIIRYIIKKESTENDGG